MLYAGIDHFLAIKTGKLRRSFTLRNLQEMLLLIWGCYKALCFILRIKPDLIFSKGGYITLPFIIWAKILRIPYFIHESDIVMGSTNRFAANSAQKVFVGFPSSSYHSNIQRKLIFSGPLVDSPTAQSCDFDFGFKRRKPVVFFAGGSQGSLKINQCLFRTLTELLPDFNIIHQTGYTGYNVAISHRMKLGDEQKSSYFIKDFLDTVGKTDLMESAIQQADLIISRAGATTIAEVAMEGKPLLLIPYKYASANHQLKNAQALERAKAAFLLIEDGLDSKTLAKKIHQLFNNPDKLKERARNAAKFFPKDGVKVVCDELINFLKDKETA